jgi:hypothetical protein
MNYNTQLCNTAWGKKLLAQVAKRTCFCFKNCDSNFFWSVGQEGRPKSKMSFHQWTKKKVLSTENGIKEMKQTKTWV